RGRTTNEPRDFFRQGRSGAWREELTTDEQKQVEEVAGDWLRELHYSPREQGAQEFATKSGKPTPYFISTVPRHERLFRWPRRLHTIESPAQMLYRERLYLYATVF